MKEELKSHFLNLYSMIIADSEISSKEKTELYRIGRELYGVTEAEIDNIIYSERILFYEPETDEEKFLYLYDMCLIAWADGKILEEEKYFLSLYAKRFGIVEDKRDELINLLIDKAQKKLSHEEFLKEFSK